MFPNYTLCSTPFTTGAKKQVTLTPKISENLVLISGDTADARSIFDYSAKVDEDGSDYKAMSSTVSFNYYLGDTAYRNICANVTLPKAGTCTLSMDTGMFKTKSDQTYSNNDYIISLGICPEVTVIDPETAVLSFNAAGTYYYGEDPDEVITNRDLILNGSVIPASSNVTYRYGTGLEGSRINTYIDKAAVKTLGAGSSFYLQAAFAQGSCVISSNAVRFIVQEMPVTVSADYNYFSVRSDTDYEENVKLNYYLRAYDMNGKELSADQVISTDAVYADFSGIDLNGIHFDAQSYGITGVRPANGNYTIASAGTGTGFGYYVFPEYNVRFYSLEARKTVSESCIISSEAAKAVKKYRSVSREADISLDCNFGFYITFPSTTVPDTETFVLSDWYGEKDGQPDTDTSYVPGKTYYLERTECDVNFYSVYRQFSEVPSGNYGALEITPVNAVNYTGYKHVTDYVKNFGRGYSKDITGFKITQVSTDYTLTEGTDYTLTYRNNLSVYTKTGDADYKKYAPCIIVKFIGAYRGQASQTVYFMIKPAILSGATASPAKIQYASTTRPANVKALISFVLTDWCGTEKSVRLVQNKDYMITAVRSSDTGIGLDLSSKTIGSAGNYIITVSGIGDKAAALQIQLLFIRITDHIRTLHP